MVVIPAGSFEMGSPATEPGHQDNEAPLHRVQIRRRFAVSRFAVTRGQWRSYAVAKARAGSPWCSWGLELPQGDPLPVVCVKWDEAQAYAGWLSRRTGHHYRLLTEAEYEYAARAGSQSAYLWGESADDLSDYANGYVIGAGSQIAPVGSFSPNAFGLFDMVGNVSSWTQDCYRASYIRAPADGSAWMAAGDCAGRVVRGGAFDEHAPQLRSARRSGLLDLYPDVGLRLACTLEPDAAASCEGVTGR
jgi:formylglycine-generating enzyme required for sulfatase activity